MPDHRSGYFWSELLHPYEAFSTAGYDCDIVSETGSATVDEASVGAMASGGDKAKSEHTHAGAQRFDDGQFPLHTKLAQMKRADQLGDPSQYAAIFFAGGHGCCADFPTAQNLQQLAARIYESGGVVGAVCHGIAIFDGLRLSSGEKLIAGRQATGFSQKGEEGMKLMDWMRKNNYSTMESIVRRNGGDWSEASNPMSEYTRTSGRVITGMNPASAKAVAQEVIKTITPDKGDKAATASASSSAVKGVSTDSTVDKQSKAYSGERTTAV